MNESESMSQPSQQNYYELIMRQLDRLEERTRNIVTRSDLEALRKELVARDSLEPLVNGLKAQIERVDKDRTKDREDLDKRIDDMEREQLSKQDRFWIRLMQGVGILGFILALFDFLSHYHP